MGATVSTSGPRGRSATAPANLKAAELHIVQPTLSTYSHDHDELLPALSSTSLMLPSLHSNTIVSSSSASSSSSSASSTSILPLSVGGKESASAQHQQLLPNTLSKPASPKLLHISSSACSPSSKRSHSVTSASKSASIAPSPSATKIVMSSQVLATFPAPSSVVITAHMSTSSSSGSGSSRRPVITPSASPFEQKESEPEHEPTHAADVKRKLSFTKQHLVGDAASIAAHEGGSNASSRSNSIAASPEPKLTRLAPEHLQPLSLTSSTPVAPLRPMQYLPSPSGSSYTPLSTPHLSAYSSASELDERNGVSPALIKRTLAAGTHGSHRTSIAQYIDNERRHAQEQQYHLHKKRQYVNQLNSSSSNALSASSLAVVYLPRGGIYVHTPAGPVQFGMPPETIKDSMKLGLTLPTYFVVPKERFNLTAGINVAEFEFPAYYNFFFKRKRINLITTPRVEPLIRSIFTETLVGPASVELPDEYGENVPRECYPDLSKEMSYFAVNPFDKSRLTVDSLLSFHFFDSSGAVRLEQGVFIVDMGEEYVVNVELKDEATCKMVVKEIARVTSDVLCTPLIEDRDKETKFHHSSADESFHPPSSLDPLHNASSNSAGFALSSTSSATLSSTTSSMALNASNSSSSAISLSSSNAPTAATSSSSSSAPLALSASKLMKADDVTAEHFVPPHFGITMLGNSDGFDTNGTTTGFVLWMNRRGIMVDPPPHSGALLKRHGISPRLMRGVILTHCHADHDAGTFQKILEEGKVVLMTTEVILDSFLRKYSAISGLEASFLRKLFVFRPVLVGQRTAIYGGHIEFFYSLHSIPCVGFSAYCDEKSMVYSADSFNDPAGIQRLFDQGFISSGRRDKLINFPWHHDLILHEAGVPPIHTPLSTLDALSPEIKQRLYIVHKPSKDVPTNTGLKSALVGPENTLVITQTSNHLANARALEVLDLLSGIDLFSGFDLSRALEILQCATYLDFAKGSTLISEGSYGDTLYVIAMGTVCVTQDGYALKQLTVGDHFGEMSIVTGEKRTASIQALTPVQVIQFSKQEFLYIVRHTDAIARLQQLGVIQRSPSWQAISANTVLVNLTSSQKTYLQSILQYRAVAAGEILWQSGEAANEAVLIADGSFHFSRAKEQAPFCRGAFVADMRAMLHTGALTTTLQCAEAGAVYAVSRINLCKFLDDNPGFKVLVMNRRFIE